MADGVYEPFPPVEAWAAVAFDAALYEEHAALLDAARSEANEDARERAVRTAIRYAGTDTGAIEGLYTTDRGFTRSVAIEAAAWEAAARERGPNAVEIIKDQIAAYEWVLDLVTQRVPVTEHVVRELHAMLCRSQESYVVHTELGRQERPLPKGEYKTFPNNPTLPSGRVHLYAPPDDVPAEMHRLVTSMGSAEFAALQPVVQAAAVHYAVAAIHPFADGNGRTARALASVPLYRDRSIPLMILAEDRDEYLDSLGAADSGDLGTFVDFVAQRVADTARLVLLTLRADDEADSAGSLEALRRVTREAETQQEREQHARRLNNALSTELHARIAAIDLPRGIRLEVDTIAEIPSEVASYRPAEAGALVVRGYSEPPATAVAQVPVPVLVAIGSTSPPLLVQAVGQSFGFEIRDIDPFERQIAKISLEQAATIAIRQAIALLAESAEAALHQRHP